MKQSHTKLKRGKTLVNVPLNITAIDIKQHEKEKNNPKPCVLNLNLLLNVSVVTDKDRKYIKII